MKTASVSAAASVLNTSTNTSTKGTDLLDSLKSSFQEVMSKSETALNNSQTTMEYTNSTTKTSQTASTTSSSSSSDTETVSTSNESTTDTDDTTTVVSTETTDKTGEEESVNDVISTYTEELKNQLEDLLDISDEDFEEMLAAMGITVADLFDPQTLQQFVLNSFGAENASEALVNEDLANALLQSSNILDDVVTALQTEIVDFDPSQLVEEMGVQTEDTSFEEVLNNQNVSDDEIDTSNVQTQDSITVEVNRETDSKTSFSDNKESDRQTGDQSKSSSDNFVDYIANNVDLSSVSNETTAVPEFKQIVTQLVDQIKLNMSQTKTSMELVLTPETLGTVQVVVAKQEGVLTARLTVENQIAKEALESSLQTLKESFENQGLKVEKVEVAIGNYSSEYDEQANQSGEQAKNSGKKKLVLGELDEETVAADDTAVESQTVKTLNATVEYTA